MSAPDARVAMLAEMCACAHELGMAFAAEARAAEDWERKVRFHELFDRCFFAVRVSIALELRLRREAGWTSREPARDPADLDRAERPEREDEPQVEGSERYVERDRDRDTERATFPLLLKTLNGVVAEAASLAGPQPAALPTLRELLAKVGAPPAATTAPPANPLKARLAGSAVTAVATLARPRPTARLAALAVRRATGPPKR